MRGLLNLLVIVLLSASAETTHGRSRFESPVPEQGGGQSASPEQEHPQASSSAPVRTVTGCLVRSDSGYSLKTDTDTLPIETDNDLSKYVNKQIKVTGILEHHRAASATTSPAVITDLRLRLVASVIGDCKQASK